MGHKFSAVHGVKSGNFYHQGNAINEIWLGDVELVSRLPFGDSDLGQAGWPEGSWPKIPWHQFIIPLKRSVEVTSNSTMATNGMMSTNPQPNESVWTALSRSLFKDISVNFLAGVLLVSVGFHLVFAPLHRTRKVLGALSFYRQVGVRASCPQWIESRIGSCCRSWCLLMLRALVIGPILTCAGLFFMNPGLQGMTGTQAIAASVANLWSIANVALAATFIYLAMELRRALAVNRQPTNVKFIEHDPAIIVTADEMINFLEILSCRPHLIELERTTPELRVRATCEVV